MDRRVLRTILRLTAFSLLLPTASARFLRLPKFQNSSNITLRKRQHVNTLITEPGTLEIDWASLYSFSSGNFSMPSALKYTPAGKNLLWSRTEYSVSFDSLNNTQIGGGRQTQFSQNITATATTVLFDGEHLDIAIAPQATFFLRDESGARLGAIAIARYDFGRNSIAGTVSWSGATHASDSNPAGTLDLGLGLGRRLTATGVLSHLTAHGNLVWERSTGFSRVVSAFEGVEIQVTERLAFDVTGQHFSLGSGATDNQVVVGLTLNLGKLQ